MGRQDQDPEYATALAATIDTTQPGGFGTAATTSAQTLNSLGPDVPVGAPVTVTCAEFPVPEWERYEFLRLLGRGGMGSVYMARDRRLGRIVALKFLHTADPAMTQRFQRE